MKAKQLQENNVDIVPITHENIVFDNNGTNIPNKYQTKEDNTLNTTDKTIVGAINELFQNVSSGKELIATAITDKGVTTSSDDTFQTMADNIELIEGGSNLPSWYEGWSSSPADAPISMTNTMDVANNKIYYMYRDNSYCYDANNNTWETKTPMPTSRGNLNLITVDDKIYCFGGEISSANYSTVNECYDPVTDSWTTKAKVINNYYLLSRDPVVSYNHKLYYLGYEVFCYDTISDTWTKLNQSGFYGDDGKITRARASVVNGIAYVFGGFRDSFATSAFNCYDISTDTWSSLNNMPIARESGSVCTVNDKIYIMGGHNTNGNLKDNKLYDPSTNTWEDKESMLNERSNFKLNLIDDIIYAIGGGTLNECYTVAENLKSENGELRNGKELIATAITNKGVPTSNNDTFQTMANNIGLIEGSSDKNEVLPKWDSNIYILNTQEPSAMPIGRRQMVSGVIDKKIYIIGGYSNNSSIALNQCYDTETNTWTDKTDDLTARYEGTASVINDNIYVIGGRYASGSFTDLNECYNSSTNTWTTKAVLPTTRTALTSSVVDNKIYVIDGSNGSQTGGNHCYDYLTDTWTTKTDDPVARYGSTSCVVNNKIYCFAGAKQNNYMTIYDPSTDTWEQKGDDSRLINRHYASSVAKNGNIYILGGYSGATYISSINKYDFETDSWIKIGDLATPRYNHVVGIVGSVVYVFGGRISADITYSDNCECICIIDNYN